MDENTSTSTPNSISVAHSVSLSRRPAWYRTMTGWILLVNVCVFLLQLFWDNNNRLMTVKGALSLEGLQAGNWWQLLSFQVLHGGYLYLGWDYLVVGLLHLGLNCLVILVMGRVLEPGIGRMGLLRIYLMSGIAGGLLHVLVAWLWPGHFDSPVVGASAGASGLVAMFATLFPKERLKVLILFVIPATMKAETLLWLTIIISVVGLTDIFKDGIAHAAHLGGILSGIWFARRMQRKLLLHLQPPPLP